MGRIATPLGLGTDIAERLHQGRELAVGHLLRHIGVDGEPLSGELSRNHYYRLPWALAVAGRPDYAAAVLSWIERNALTPHGDLRPDAQEPFIAGAAAYPLAIIATGAWHLERYDTARSIMDTLLSYQDPVSGGAYSQRPEARESDRQELFPTAQLGMTALTCGRADVAAGCCRWVTNLYTSQPDLPKRLYTGWDRNGLIVDVDDDLAFELLTDFEEPKQAFYNPGIAAAFLARYAMQTGARGPIDLARLFLRLSAEGTERQFDHTESKQICKYGWGAGLMVEADREGDHLPATIQMAEWFLDGQLEDGSWHDSPFLCPSPTAADDVEITAEFVLHLTTIMQALGGGSRP